MTTTWKCNTIEEHTCSVADSSFSKLCVISTIALAHNNYVMSGCRSVCGVEFLHVSIVHVVLLDSVCVCVCKKNHSDGGQDTPPLWVGPAPFLVFCQLL